MFSHFILLITLSFDKLYVCQNILLKKHMDTEFLFTRKSCQASLIVWFFNFWTPVVIKKFIFLPSESLDNCGGHRDPDVYRLYTQKKTNHCYLLDIGVNLRNQEGDGEVQTKPKADVSSEFYGC